MNFMVEVVAVPWMGQLSYVGALTKSKLCQLSKLKYSAHVDFLVTNFIIKFIDCAVKQNSYHNLCIAQSIDWHPICEFVDCATQSSYRLVKFLERVEHINFTVTLFVISKCIEYIIYHIDLSISELDINYLVTFNL